MSIFKKIVSVFNDLTDHTVMADDTVLESIPTKKNFLTKEFEENLVAFYDQLPAPMKHNVYHDDYAFFRETMIDLYKQCLGDSYFTLPKADLPTCNAIYNDVWVRRLTGASDVTEVYRSLKNKRSYMDDIILQQLIIISWEIMKNENGSSRVTEPDDLSRTKEPDDLLRTKESDVLSRMLKNEVIGNPEGDSGAEKRYQNDPDYGLVPEKPIFVNGFMGSHSYLSMLQTDKGELLRTERRGSTKAEGINGLVDIYDTFRVNDHSAYGTIYICLYGNSTSNQAPKGYVMGSDPFTEMLQAPPNRNEDVMGSDPITREFTPQENFEVIYGPEPMDTPGFTLFNDDPITEATPNCNEVVKGSDPITNCNEVVKGSDPITHICRNCSHEYTEGDRYCRYCGAPLGEPWKVQEVFEDIYGPEPTDTSDSIIIN